jgi:topoisomerase IA-like protein
LASITLAQAVELFKQPKAGRQRTAAVLADIGKHPETDAPIQVKSGRYGPYVTDGEVNATVPKGKDPAGITLDQAIELIRAREQKLKDQGKDPRAKAKKSAAKKSGKATKKTSGKSGAASQATKGGATKSSKKSTQSATKSKTAEYIESLGPPPEGYAWTRTGKPVVETWPEGTLACPNCGSDMALKSGRFGPFYSCTNYPTCKTSINLRGEAKKRAEQEMPAPERAAPIPTDIVCEDCGAKMVIRKSRGRAFLGCSAYPTCRATQPLPPELEAVAASNP